MKELSIEQKAKAYDEALNWMRDLFPNLGIAAKEKAESIFKELRESEDEKIRKELIDIVKKSPITFAFEDKGKVLAWLEKQGRIESDPRYENLEELLAADDIYQMSMNDEMVREAKEKAVNALSGMCIGRLLGLEKQGKQKPSLRERYDKIKDSEWFKKTHEGMSISDDENVDGDMKETEHTIEPKFHEGDWVILTAGELSDMLQIVNVDTYKKRYWFNDNSYLPIVDEECLHHWSIEDAKPGDVLACDADEKPFIFKGLLDPNHPNYPVAYCGIDDEDYFSVSSGVSWWIDGNVHPATKEQRDLLFSKMKESGYEWNTEKKELKLLITNGVDFSETENCGQKPVEWKQENREELTEFENAMMHIGGSFFGENAGLDPNDTATIKEQAKLLLELAPKIEWSKGDMEMLNAAISFVEHSSFTTIGKGKNNTVAWLKSLKDRYAWKPSSEQLYILHWLATNVLGDGVVDKKASEILYTLYDDLKKL